jgi:restriction endonuclease Mrr
LKDYYLDNFQEKHQEFVAENALPDKNGDKVLIKYFATLENIIEKPVSRIPSNKYYIWTNNHVKNYITGKTAFIWALRVYTLKEPYRAEPTLGAINYANLKEKISLEGLNPVLSGNEFAKVFNEI